MFQLNTTAHSSCTAFKGISCNFNYVYQVTKVSNPLFSESLNMCSSLPHSKFSSAVPNKKTIEFNNSVSKFKVLCIGSYLLEAQILIPYKLTKNQKQDIVK